MENKLQKANTNSLSSEIRNMGVELFHYNQLTTFPLSDAQIIDWAKSISEIAPNLTIEILHEIIRRFKIGQGEFDSRLGIQNIFNGYRTILREQMEDVGKKIHRGWNYPTDEEKIISDEAQKKFDEIKKQFDGVFAKKEVSLYGGEVVNLPKVYDN